MKAKSTDNKQAIVRHENVIVFKYTIVFKYRFWDLTFMRIYKCAACLKYQMSISRGIIKYTRTTHTRTYPKFINPLILMQINLYPIGAFPKLCAYIKIIQEYLH